MECYKLYECTFFHKNHNCPHARILLMRTRLDAILIEKLKKLIAAYLCDQLSKKKKKIKKSEIMLQDLSHIRVYLQYTRLRVTMDYSIFTDHDASCINVQYRGL